jgi:hypothetical protein
MTQIAWKSATLPASQPAHRLGKGKFGGTTPWPFGNIDVTFGRAGANCTKARIAAVKAARAGDQITESCCSRLVTFSAAERNIG